MTLQEKANRRTAMWVDPRMTLWMSCRRYSTIQYGFVSKMSSFEKCNLILINSIFVTDRNLPVAFAKKCLLWRRWIRRCQPNEIPSRMWWSRCFVLSTKLPSKRMNQQSIWWIFTWAISFVNIQTVREQITVSMLFDTTAFAVKWKHGCFRSAVAGASNVWQLNRLHRPIRTITREMTTCHKIEISFDQKAHNYGRAINQS